MTPYLDLPALARALLSSWEILLCMGFIAHGARGIIQRRPLPSLVSFGALVCSFLLFQVAADASAGKLGAPADATAAAVSGLPAAFFVCLLAVLSALWLAQFHDIRSYKRTHITSASIKEAVDELPAGICIYGEDGQVLLANHAMARLSVRLTGTALSNGRDLENAVKDTVPVALRDGTVWRFTKRTLDAGGGRLHEIVADDITELHRKTEKLHAENKRLHAQNERMREYGAAVGDIVRTNELLRAKADVHDEMNRLLLETDFAINEGTDDEKRRILQAWTMDVLLLCMQEDSRDEQGRFSDLAELAKLIGIELVFDNGAIGSPTTEGERHALRLFMQAAEECMANAVKHAGARRFRIDLEESPDGLIAEFRNDGTPALSPVVESGGLGTLRQRIEATGGTMDIVPGPEFTVKVRIGKGA